MIWHSMSQAKTLPPEITSYDLLKTLALILMIIDHTGHFFFPYDARTNNVEVVWFRVLGRFCIPIWFFLIGYAQTTAIPKRLWVCAGLVTLSAMVSGGTIFPLNILFTIIAARYVRDGVARKALESPEHMRGIFFLLLLGTLPSSLMFEYGSIILFFVIFGQMRRFPDKMSMDKRYLYLFVFLSFFLFLFSQGLTLNIPEASQALALFVGFGLVAMVLWRFKPATYPKLTRALGPLRYLLMFTGRRTLEIYTAHLILFRGGAMVLFPQQYPFWGWKIIDPALLSMIMP